MEKFIIIHRQHGGLQLDTDYHGPFPSYDDAESYLVRRIPLLGLYDQATHDGKPGCRFIQPLCAVQD